MQVPWHTITPEDVLQKLGSKRSGLSAAEVSERRSQHGPNELHARKKTSPIVVFLQQFLSPLIYVLIVAAAVSAILGEYIDALVIAMVLLLNAVIGFAQETRAETAVQALLKLAAPRAKVRREGRIEQVPSRELVPGDIILIETGDKVPADARLIEQASLKSNEAPLTGESMSVDKSTDPLPAETPIAERKNMVYMGTTIGYGRATAVVTATGMTTEMGKIASGIQEAKEEKTPIQESISRLSRYIIFLFLVVIGILIVIGIYQGLGFFEMFLLAVAAAVSAIPEGLPAVVTVVLAVGMQLMARRNAIIRRLVAVETLGSATVICSDKTGTLTLNEMTVRRIWIDGMTLEVTGEGYRPEGQFRQDGRVVDPAELEALRMHLRIGALASDATLTSDDSNFDIYGDPTEGALVVAAAKAQMTKEKLEKAFPRLDEIPFQSEKQYMATLHPAREGGRVIYVKGAPEKLLAMSKSICLKDKPAPLKEQDIEAIMAANTAMAQAAMRVIATAYAPLPSDVDGLRDDYLRDNLVFVGLSGMADPPREEAKEAIRQAREAGIRVVMITGDNKLTAESIARQIGLPPGKAITGSELQKMDDKQLAAEIESISVFARIEPLHKLRIVNALKARGETVAMTGDGVNDAPALKTANIGISMGITGTDVAKEASDMVLADDNFASVVAAVEEGRAIFNRLRSVIFFLLGTNLGELVLLILAVGLTGVSPLVPVQLIWVNLVTDSTGAIPLGLEPKAGDEMKQPPRHPAVGLLYPGLAFRVLFLAILMGTATYLVFYWAQDRLSLEEARTLTFTALAASQWFQAFNARSDEHNILQIGVTRNRWLIFAILVSIVLQITVIYVPFLQVAFSTVPLNATDWYIVVGAGMVLFIIEEVRKVLFPRLFSLGKWQPVQWPWARGQDVPLTGNR